MYYWKRNGSVLVPLDPSDYAGKKGVYFICNNQHIKIGKAKDIASRLGELQVGNFEQLFLMGVIPDVGIRREGQAHVHLAKYRVRGEWFHWEKKVDDYIRDHCKFRARRSVIWGRPKPKGKYHRFTVTEHWRDAGKMFWRRGSQCGISVPLDHIHEELGAPPSWDVACTPCAEQQFHEEDYYPKDPHDCLNGSPVST